MKISKRSIKRIFVALVALSLFTLCASWFIAGQLIAPSPKLIGKAPGDLPISTISLRSDSGAEISGWHLKASSSKGVIVLLHGIRSSRLDMLQRARMFYKAGYSSIMIDLQAHGESSGEHITMGFLEKHDVTAAVSYARSQHLGEALTVLGLSLGGASALLASPLDIDTKRQ